MTQQFSKVLTASLLALGLHGQESSSRYGIALGGAMPQQLHAATGISAGLNIHFNQNTSNEGRIRIEGVSFGSKTETTSVTTLESQGSALTLSYDWMPGSKAIRPIFGVGGMSWSQKLQQNNTGALLGFKSYGGTKSGIALVPTLGIQYRITNYIHLEARYAFPVNITKDKNYYFSYGEDNSIRQMNYLAVGVEIRLPNVR